jgi:flagellar protein FlbD
VIQLTRLNNEPLTVNSDLIKFVEGAHDTVLTLINGEKIVVRERVEQVIERVIQFRRAVLTGLPMMTAYEPGAATSPKPDTQTATLDLKEGAGRG